MTSSELKEEIEIELEWMQSIIDEIISLREDVGEHQPSVREKTAAASFLAQFYNGIENILKRISLFHKIELPISESWHINLMKRFCDPPYLTLPNLFDPQLEFELSQYRKFRHVVLHSYGFQIEWDRMKEGLFKIETIFDRFCNSLINYLKTL